MTAPRILYLEDEENDVMLLRETLASAGVVAELVHVHTPSDFAAALTSQVANVILIDGTVAGFGGVTAMQLARAACPAVPSFCLTGLVTDETVAAMHEAGAAGCLSKHDLVQVSATIRRALESRPTKSLS